MMKVDYVSCRYLYIGTIADLHLVYRIDEYIPDALYDSWESVRDFAIDWLIRVGVLGRGSKGASKSVPADGPRKPSWSLATPNADGHLMIDVTAAREKHNNANNDLNRLNNDIRTTSETIDRMSTGFGPDAEWKKLDGTCIDKISGE
jgi:protein kinase C substrate 80K-H